MTESKQKDTKYITELLRNVFSNGLKQSSSYGKSLFQHTRFLKVEKDKLRMCSISQSNLVKAAKGRVEVQGARPWALLPPL